MGDSSSKGFGNNSDPRLRLQPTQLRLVLLNQIGPAHPLRGADPHSEGRGQECEKYDGGRMAEDGGDSVRRSEVAMRTGKLG
jgi:hypothetical protein